MVEREGGCTRLCATVLAGKLIPHEDELARQRRGSLAHWHIAEQAQHCRQRMLVACTANERIKVLQHLCPLEEVQHHGPTPRNHGDRLKREVQNQSVKRVGSSVHTELYPAVSPIADLQSKRDVSLHDAIPPPARHRRELAHHRPPLFRYARPACRVSRVA